LAGTGLLKEDKSLQPLFFKGFGKSTLESSKCLSRVTFRHLSSVSRPVPFQEALQTELPVVVAQPSAIASELVELPLVISTIQSAKEEVVVEPQPSKIASDLVKKDQEFMYDLPQPLPSSLRGLRSYIIEHKLQARIREVIGKSYSHCKLSDLQFALSHI
jgi:hypothetical protein